MICRNSHKRNVRHVGVEYRIRDLANESAQVFSVFLKFSVFSAVVGVTVETVIIQSGQCLV